MRSCYKLLCLAVTLVGAGISQPIWAAEIWVSPVHITRIYPQADGSVVLTVDNDNNSCANPAVPKYYQIIVGQNGVTADGLKNMLATALSAFAMNKTVSINIDDSTPNCYINRLFIQ